MKSKVRIEIDIPAIKTLGNYDVNLPWDTNRRVYIDNKRMPDALAEVFLTGMDSLIDQHINRIKLEMISE